MRRLGLICVFAACGGSGSSTPDPDGPPATDDGAVDPDGPPPDTSTAFAITSPVFDEGGNIPATFTCDGANTSPQLDWVNAPAGTMSFAIVFTDTTNGLIHSVIYDIPANVTGLPADVDPLYEPQDVVGAHQTRAFSNQFGYAGPCPPANDGPHLYEFALYALDATPLPTATMQTTRVQAKALIEAHDLARVTLSANYDRN